MARRYWLDIERFYDAPRPTGAVSEAAQALHADCCVLDMHCDCMLWSRALNERNAHGHVDFPRMREGGVDGVAITIPTSRIIVPQAIHRRWPRRTWTSHWQRFLHQIEVVERALAASDGGARLARTAAEVRENRRAGVLSIFHGIEGAMAFERDLARVEAAAARGVLYVGLTHFFDNPYGGHGGGDGRGLSDLGRACVERMNEHGLMLDTAHASRQTLIDAVAASAFPPVNSHTGVKAIKDHWRNLGDDEIRAIGERGGVIGGMFGGLALHRPRIEEVLAHMQHVIDLIGDDHVALGSDWDGFVKPAVDASTLPHLTDAMLARGWSEARVRKILGENLLRVWSERDRILADRAR